MYKIIKLIYCFLIILNNFVYSQDSLQNNKKYNKISYLPGGSFYLKGEITKGVIFTTLPVSLVTSSILLKDKLPQNTSSAYSNYLLLSGFQSYSLYSMDAAIDVMSKVKSKVPSLKYDSLSFNQLVFSPFKPKNIFTPIVGVFSVLAGAQLAFSYHNSKITISDVDKIGFFDKLINKKLALPYYSSVSLGVSLGAGTVEEYLFRNMLLPTFDLGYGQKKGLLYSSLIFGGIHYLNLLMADKPNFGATTLQVMAASGLGYLLGRDVQKRGYKIGPAIAAHTLYNFILSTGSFLIDPEHNYIGVNMKFKL